MRSPASSSRPPKPPSSDSPTNTPRLSACVPEVAPAVRNRSSINESRSAMQYLLVEMIAGVKAAFVPAPRLRDREGLEADVAERNADRSPQHAAQYTTHSWIFY